MLFDKAKGKARPDGFLTRLARDRRGNTMIMMAMALIPTAAFAGSAVDMGRLYVVKVRLQQACDAGALAGRRVLVEDEDHQIDVEALRQANQFFDNNFKNGWLGTRRTVRSFNESGTQQVQGTAESDVPMAVMGMFNQRSKTIKVACAARVDVPDVDIMLVLDTTGSMACSPEEPGNCPQSATRMTYTRSDGTTGYAAQEKSTSRIVGLRAAVLDFYDVMDTYTDDRTNIRYGIVPYTSTVNVGVGGEMQVPQSWIENTTFPYWTRRAVADNNVGDPVERSFTNVSKRDCEAARYRSPTGTSARNGFDYRNDGRANVYTYKSWTGSNGGTCVVNDQLVEPRWRYSKQDVDVSRFSTGAATPDLSKYNDGDRPSRWQGCVEDLSTTPATGAYDHRNLPPDLDPDAVPGAGGRRRLGPMWSGTVFHPIGILTGQGDTQNDNLVAAQASVQEYWTTRYRELGHKSWQEIGNVSCGMRAQRLKTMTRAEVSDYLNKPEFKPLGGTYHDTGMIWATRFISPTGPFKDDTKAYPGRTEPNRHIVFMTDGEMSPSFDLYGMYGVERFDGRVGGGNWSASDLKARHNARFRAICEAAKNPRNITVWVIAFGQALDDDLTGCATQPGSQHAIHAKSTDELRAAFRRIAKQVASLRVYQ